MQFSVIYLQIFLYQLIQSQCTSTISILSTDHLEQRVAAVAVGLLVVLHQAVQRAELQALVHQRAAPGQTQGTELSLKHFINKGLNFDGSF